MSSNLHTFHALAFVENFPIKELAVHYPEAKRVQQQLFFQATGGGTVFLYAFGAVVFLDMPQPARETEIQRLRKALPRPTSAQVLSEEFSVREVPGARLDVDGGTLFVDALSAERASIVALTVGQSVAMEYYEGIVDQMFVNTDKLVERLEKVGTMSILTRKLHRFIGAAIGTRNEVLSVLHLLDKPDAVWDDPGADQIYKELRAEFELVDRYESMELKLRSVQEALELVTDIARDRRLVLLEASIVALIVMELAINIFKH